MVGRIESNEIDAVTDGMLQVVISIPDELVNTRSEIAIEQCLNDSALYIKYFDRTFSLLIHLPSDSCRCSEGVGIGAALPA